jgi:sensor histidine kinase YesM
MFGSIGLALPRSEGDYLARVARALDRRRVGAGALVTLLLSLGPLFGSGLLDFFSPAEAALAWLEHLVELAVIAAALMAVYTLLDEALPAGLPWRLGVLCMALCCVSLALALLLYGYYAHGFEHLPPPMRLLADSLRWGLPAAFLAGVADVHRRAMQADAAAGAAEVSGVRVAQGESEQQLALLQAQLEPHFLFNVLGNVRRLYRTRPLAGADAVASLMRYLHTALPQVRNRSGCLGDEIELVRSYLELFQVRMGARLTYSIDVDPALHDDAFPPMLLMTLVENAIKHGLDPAGGGHVLIHAQPRGDRFEVAVHDDGVGFGAAASSGTGVGLANVRRQLAARYHDAARLLLQSREPRGASATLLIPRRHAGPPGPSPADMRGQQASNRNTATASLRPSHPARGGCAAFARWLHAHRGAIAMAALLSFAAPLTFFAGALSVMRDPAAADWTSLGFWWVFYGIAFWMLLLVLGHVCLHVTPRAGPLARAAVWLSGALAAAAGVTVSTAARAAILIDQGVVQNVQTMHLYSFTFSLTMALLYFAHLRRSRRHEEAAARLAAAQTGQREAGLRIMQSRLQALQARISPQLLFDMLDAVRRSYQVDAARAEQLLDELIGFLRAALPRLRGKTSSVPREAELARSYARLQTLAGAHEVAMTVEVSAEAAHARFPPGVLLPLLDGALRACAGACTIDATRSAGTCRLVLTLPAPAPEAALDGARSLLSEVDPVRARLTLHPTLGARCITVTVPYEPA